MKKKDEQSRRHNIREQKHEDSSQTRVAIRCESLNKVNAIIQKKLELLNILNNKTALAKF